MSLSLIEQVFGRVDRRYNNYVDAKAEVLEVEPEKVTPSVTQADSQAEVVELADYRSRGIP